MNHHDAVGVLQFDVRRARGGMRTVPSSSTRRRRHSARGPARAPGFVISRIASRANTATSSPNSSTSKSSVRWAELTPPAPRSPYASAGTHELAPAADPHRCDALVPAGITWVAASAKLNGCFTVTRTVEFSSVGERADVVHVAVCRAWPGGLYRSPDRCRFKPSGSRTVFAGFAAPAGSAAAKSITKRTAMERVITAARELEAVPHPCRGPSSVPPGSTKRLVVDGVETLLCNVDGAFYAIEDVCTHDGGRLDQGTLEGCQIRCPRHGRSST